MTKPVNIDDAAVVRPEEPKENVADVGGQPSGTESATADNVYGEGASGAFAEDLYQPRYPPKEERKVRNELAKLDLILVPGVNRVTVRKNNNFLYVIANPEVYKNPTSDSYIVYGNAQMIDLEKQEKRQNSSVANMLGVPLVQGPSNISKKPPPYARPELKAKEEDELVDYTSTIENSVEVASEQESVSKLLGKPPPYAERPMMNVEQESEINYMGLNEKDVNVICKQANVSKQVAINALLENDNDVVNAIIALAESMEI